MIEELNRQIKEINQLLDKLPTEQKELAEQRFFQLMEERRKLKIIRNAAADNPGIGVLGKTWVDKNYLINQLLKSKSSPFTVSDGNGEKHELESQINNIDEGKLGSGVVVRRYSSFKRSPDIYNPNLPILARIFNVADIITILSDCYYNEIADYTSPSISEVIDLSRDIYEKYINEPRISSPVLQAEDILNIKQYFKKYINNAQTFISERCTLFDRIALVIDRIPDKEYVSIFSNLWSKDPNFTRLFNRLYDILKQLHFSNYVYLPIDSVLHKGIFENSIMSIRCLRELLDEQTNYTTDAYIRENNQFVKRATAMPKSEISAVCAEVIFKIEDDFLDSTGQYDLTGVGEDVKQVINQGIIAKSMFRDNDLLDFPITCSHEEERIKYLQHNHVLLHIFYYRKMAYLFKKYNDEKRINILLYCHNNKDNDATDLWRRLEDWVNTYVGKTPEERHATVENAGAPPLFYIATMFNLDMAPVSWIEPTEQNISRRWHLRFNTVANNQCFHRNSVEWVKSWTGNGTAFKNSYLLRDFIYSGGRAGLYDGFRETGKETCMIMSDDYYQILRQSFINNEYCRQFFSNPALSWDVAATQNNDGSLYIIENLQRVCSRIGKVRADQFNKQIEQVKTRIQYMRIEDS